MSFLFYMMISFDSICAAIVRRLIDLLVVFLIIINRPECHLNGIFLIFIAVTISCYSLFRIDLRDYCCFLLDQRFDVLVAHLCFVVHLSNAPQYLVLFLIQSTCPAV